MVAARRMSRMKVNTKQYSIYDTLARQKLLPKKKTAHIRDSGSFVGNDTVTSSGDNVRHSTATKIVANRKAMQAASVERCRGEASACSEQNFYPRYVINNNHLLKCIDMCCAAYSSNSSIRRSRTLHTIVLNTLPR